MKIINGIENYVPAGGHSFVALGAFDGIHPGHVKIIETMVTKADASGGEPIVLTFHPHPRAFVSNSGSFGMINTQEEKAEIMRSLGVGTMLVLNFDAKLAEMSPGEFASHILREKLRAEEVLVGFNFCFGANRSGNASILTELGEHFGFRVSVFGGVEVGGFVVSSSKIRLLIEAGAVDDVIRFMGRPYFLTGVVVEGDGLGGRLHFPTANISILEKDKIVPKNGVYIVKCSFGGKTYNGLMNIGTRPTVYEKRSTLVTFELHIMNFGAAGEPTNIYGEKVRVIFLKRIRDERRFHDFAALREQIGHDLGEAEDFFSQPADNYPADFDPAGAC